LGGTATINGRAEVQLEEVRRITPEVRALIDSERSSAEQCLTQERQAFVDICGKLGIPCHVTARRATENYFTERAVQAAKGTSFRALGPYEVLKTAPNPWAKGDNWKIAAEMTVGEITSTDLGAFLNSL
jgi:hypothetical protein